MPRTLCHVFAMFLLTTTAYAGEWKLPQKSTFVVVTNKAGIAKAAAHDHVISAKSYTSDFWYKDGKVGGSIVINAKDLEVDSWPLVKELSPELVKLGLVEEAPSQISEGDRKTIKANMLDKDQLWEKKYPKIQAWAKGLKKEPASIAKFKGNSKLLVKLSVRDATNEKWVPCQIEWGSYDALCVGEYSFKALGIEPYSALLGAIANADKFYLYLKTKLKK